MRFVVIFVMVDLVFWREKKIYIFSFKMAMCFINLHTYTYFSIRDNNTIVGDKIICMIIIPELEL